MIEIADDEVIRCIEPRNSKWNVGCLREGVVAEIKKRLQSDRYLLILDLNRQIRATVIVEVTRPYWLAPLELHR